MSYSIVRLTLYGLLSSIETDLRQLVRSQVCRGASYTTVLGPELQAVVHRRAQQDGNEDGDLLEYLDFGDTIKTLQSNRSVLDVALATFIKQNSKDLEKLAPIRNRVMHSRPLKFNDSATVFQVVSQALKTARVLFPVLSAMERQLGSDPDYAMTLKMPATLPEASNTTTNLPLPDFDETGFLGRHDEVLALCKVLKGPYPVITVLGEGGVGKTALALEAAYELLDDPAEPFQAIIWATSKSTRLTVNDIERIEGAIEDSLGIFKAVSRELAGPASGGSLDEVLEYLNAFKVLLILDNLETVLDDSIRQFLYRLSGSSKILITSRVGIGELNYPFPLSGMGRSDAQQLLRITGQVRRVAQIAQATNPKLAEYCARMKDNPAYIKWFVTAVQCGRRPDEILANPDLFLDFCLSDVYRYLDADSTLVANALLSVPGRHAQPVLSYLTGLDGVRFQTALRRLITTNVAVMSPQQMDGGADNVYELGDLPRAYLIRHHPPSGDEVLAFQRKKREIASTHERLAAATHQDRYNPNSMSLRSRDDTAVATYLIDALKKVRNENYDAAFDLIERAKALAPSYFEVYRVEGWAHSFSGNVPAARESYEMAVQLEPRSAPVRFWYGGYLLRNGDDVESADIQLSEAVKLDPQSPAIQAESGRVKMYRGLFAEAENAFCLAFRSEEATLKIRRISYDGWLQTSVRKAELELARGEFVTGLRDLGHVLRKFDNVENDCIDSKIIETIGKSVPLWQRLSSELRKTDHVAAINEGISKVMEILQLHRVSEAGEGPAEIDPTGISLGKVYRGYVETLKPEGGYGFVQADGIDKALFFHRSALPNPSLFSSLSIGQEVRFVVGREGGSGRILASEVMAINESSERPPVSRKGGIVKSYGENGHKFGFIRSDDGAEYFFHRNNLSKPEVSQHVTSGARVSFTLGRNSKGVVADEVMIIDPSTPNQKLDEFARSSQYVFGEISCLPTTGSCGCVMIEDYGVVALRESDFRRRNDVRRARVGSLVRLKITRDIAGYVADDVNLM